MTQKIATIFFACSLLFLASCTKKNQINTNAGQQKQSAIPLKVNKDALNFYVISDWGWNGFVNQREVAEEMANLSDSIEPKFIVSCGDNFQVQGVASATDPLWQSTFENVYRKPTLHVDWYPILGNHDYRGNTDAQIEYSKISRRWRMESHYYSVVKKVNDTISARLIFLDTPPLVKEYYKKSGYPDVFKQDTAQQMKWLKDILASSTEKWKLVFGHHPVYSASQKHGNTDDLIKKLKPLFTKYNVQLYVCGHDHDMQHLKEKNGTTDFFVTGTGGDVRPASTNEMSLFSQSIPGFSLITIHADSLRYFFVDTKGQAVYTMKRSWKK